MEGTNRVSAVLCSTDLARSQDFYENKIGLRLSPETIKNHLLFECGDETTLLVYGRPAPNRADHTQVRFWSEDLEADVQALAAQGVVFEELGVSHPEDRRRHRDHSGYRQVGVVQGPGRQHPGPVPAGVDRSGGTGRDLPRQTAKTKRRTQWWAPTRGGGPLRTTARRRGSRRDALPS